MSFGGLLRMAREAAGLTQQQVSDLSNIPQPHISRAELDRHIPNDETAERLASALGVTPAFFRQRDSYLAATAVLVHARRRKTASPLHWRRCEARINVHRIRIDRLVKGVELRPVNHIPVLGSEHDPALAARLVRMSWRMPLGPVHDLVGWLESSGAIVLVESLGVERIDGLSQWQTMHPLFVASLTAPVDRLRWTLAHELGHLVLHDEPVPDMESEADQFAAEFLMPEADIRDELVRPNLGDLLPIKAEWGVSLQGLVNRAHQLGTITGERRVSIYKQLSARQWRKNEPGSEELAPERPRLLQQVVEAHRLGGAGLKELEDLAFVASGSSDSNLYFGERGWGRHLALVQQSPFQEGSQSS